MWDEWADVHWGSDFYDVEGFKRGDERLDDFEPSEVGDVSGKTLLHLQCHFGIDSLSWVRRGATVTGVDFSPRAIELAQRLAREAGLEARFIRSDLGGLPDLLDETFDVVYTSKGVLGWLPDLAAWGRVAAHFVRPDGIFYINEFHPIAWVFDDRADRLRLKYPYFPRAEPLVLPVQGTYADPEADTQAKVEYGWTFSMGSVVTALADAGLTIEFLRERPSAPAQVLALYVQREDGRWYLPDDVEGELPLSFSLRARKTR